MSSDSFNDKNIDLIINIPSEASGNVIKSELEEYLKQTADSLNPRDAWEHLNIPELSENELMALANNHDLNSDEQTRTFCKFIALGTNFASVDFTQKLLLIPELVTNLKVLLEKMEKEIQEFADIANCFSNLIQSFAKLTLHTKHNMKMILPHLQDSVLHMQVISQALMPESSEKLENADRMDIEMGLSNMSKGIVNLLVHSKASRDECIQLDKKINYLRCDIQERVTLSRNRLTFQNILPKLGVALGLATGASATSMALESIAFGGAGTLVLGGLTFPPLGAVLVGAAIGSCSIGSILFLIIKLWQKQQFRAIEYLTLILENLNKLNIANLAFLDYMNKSEEEANRILVNLHTLTETIKSGSHRYRKLNSEICNKAVDSTKDMIKCINEIDKINVTEWMSDRENKLPDFLV